MKQAHDSQSAAPVDKPRLRGHIHQEAFFVALGAGAMLIVKSEEGLRLFAACVYSLGLMLLFGISAIYHRVNWSPSRRILWKRLDHSAIFVLIACTATPYAVLVLPEPDGKNFLTLVWIVGVLGILQSNFWVRAPKWLTALLGVGAGCVAFIYFPQLKANLTPANLLLTILGGAAYTIGAVFYALKKPNFFPGTFGYHELFHALTIVGAIMYFMVIYNLV